MIYVQVAIRVQIVLPLSHSTHFIRLPVIHPLRPRNPIANSRISHSVTFHSRRCALYHSCLYCAKDLGRNDVLEAMAVGRRLAFDAGKGRLWLICTSCVKWNLVPFDSRLEAIDACERVFRETRTRYSTGNIGLARHREGLELIRVGPALRPEFASWRYGEQVARRRRAAGGLGADALGALNWLITVVAGEQLGSMPFREITSGAMRALHQHRVLRDPWTDQLVQVPYVALIQASLKTDDHAEWRLEVPYRTGAEHLLNVAGSALPSIRDVPSLGLFSGSQLLPTLGRLLPALDDGATGHMQVPEAVRLVETANSPERLFEYVVGRPLRFATQREYPLREIPAEVRLALEMVAHEDTEQRAMEGELKLLERQWREAELVAEIADGLALNSKGARLRSETAGFS